ncbi:transposase, partial [Mycobacterium helveticum]|uniref:transposase n=1 Tax=Mycobacterium helveticum TaxID=2592811 RepID=UPI001FEF24F7
MTGNAGMVAVTELLDRLDVIGLLDAATGPIKQRDRGFGPGELLVGMAAAQLAGHDFLVGLDRHRADVAAQALTPVPGLASTTAAGLAKRFTDQQWRATESGLAKVSERMLALLPAERAAALCEGATIDLDTTDVEVYGRKKDGIAYNHQGQRVGRPHVASWAETETVLAADLDCGLDDPRATAEDLLQRALAGLPRRIRRERVRLRADAGYFAGQLARAAHKAGIGFAIGAKRVTTMWRALAGIAETDWRAAIDMPDAQVAVSTYAPADWPPNTRLLIRRVRLTVDQVSPDARSRRRRTLHPDQRALPLAELAHADAIYAYSFIATNLDTSTPDKAAAVEHWYRHRTSVENIFRDSKHGAALRHLPSGNKQVNTAWMWGALLAASIAGWLHQLTGTILGDDLVAGHGVRDGKA